MAQIILLAKAEPMMLQNLKASKPILILKFKIMAKSSGLVNAPSTTGRPSGGGRGNNPQK
jgi:hypothetical protein